MAARIREEQVWLSRHLEERLAETTASGTLRLPGELPDVARAVHWRGFACVEKVTAQPQLGWVEAAGRVRVWVSYVAAGSESPDPAAAVWGGRLEGELPFTYRLDAGTFHDSARWSVRAQVGAVDGRFRADGRTADVDVVLQLAFQGVERQPTRLVTHASSTGPCRIEASTTLLRTSLAEALERTRVQVSDERELGANLPAAAGRPRVVEVEATPAITQARVEAGTVSVEGVVRFDVLFVQPRPARAAATAPEPADAAEAASPEATAGADRGWEVSWASWTSGEAFRFTLPVEQARPGDTVRARATAADVVARPAGGSRFAFEVEVELEVGLYSPRAVQVATDVRGCEQLPVEQRKSTVTVEQWLAELRRSFAASATLELPAGLPPVERVLWAGVTLHPHPPRPDGPRVLVSASCTPWMFYVPYKADARTGGLGFVEWTGAMALEQPLALPELRPGAQLACSVSFAGVAVEADLINRQTVELSVAGILLLGGRQAHAQEVVAEAVAIQARAQDPPPFFYLVVTQAGDTLWKLSRRYDVPVQALVEANPELQAVPAEEPLPAGRKLFVRRGG
ncbi:MAG TPA: LysM domain-containing protein [Limnochordales bacterium]